MVQGGARCSRSLIGSLRRWRSIDFIQRLPDLPGQADVDGLEPAERALVGVAVQKSIERKDHVLAPTGVQLARGSPSDASSKPFQARPRMTAAVRKLKSRIKMTPCRFRRRQDGRFPSARAINSIEL